MFWSGETIKKRLGEIINLEDGSKPSENQIDCAAYTLRIGPEYFLTSQDQRPKGNTKIKLEEGEQFSIPPGQFIFLLTEEIVNIPKDVIAFISCKTTYKFKGLINVSGFHVDPGYKGRLVFSLYNAGPKEIPLSRGSEFFLIWFANLDKLGNEYVKKDNQESKKIDDKLVGGIIGEIFSPINVKKKIDDLKGDLSKVEIRIYKWFFLTLIGVVIVVFHKPILQHLFFPNEKGFNET